MQCMVSSLPKLIPSLIPCHHAFCYDCIRYRMSRGRATKCVLCLEAISKVIVASAPMEIPEAYERPSRKVSARECFSTGADEVIPIEIQRRLPSLSKLRPFLESVFGVRF
jgi:hypothetical protein